MLQPWPGPTPRQPLMLMRMLFHHATLALDLTLEVPRALQPPSSCTPNQARMATRQRHVRTTVREVPPLYNRCIQQHQRGPALLAPQMSRRHCPGPGCWWWDRKHRLMQHRTLQQHHQQQQHPKLHSLPHIPCSKCYMMHMISRFLDLPCQHSHSRAPVEQNPVHQDHATCLLEQPPRRHPCMAITIHLDSEPR